MSRQDHDAERLVADQYEAVRPPVEPPKPGQRKRFAEDLLTGYAVGRVIRKIVG